MRINRRHFLQAGAAATAALALPFRAFPFSQSLTGIKKFVVPLPGLGPTGIPVLTGDTTAFPGFVTYSITAGPFTQKLHPDIPNPTKLWGYADASTPNLRYLGGVIVAKRGTPVKLKVLNRLPAEHILPVGDRSFVSPSSHAGSTGRPALQTARVHQDPGDDRGCRAGHHPGSGPAAAVHARAELLFSSVMAVPRGQRSSRWAHSSGAAAPDQPRSDSPVRAGGFLVVTAEMARDRRRHGVGLHHDSGLLETRHRVHAAPR